MISTRGRYALRVIIDLAEHRSGKYIPMKAVAERQDISLKYLERILPDLTGGKIIEGIHGKGGGYCLSDGAAPCAKKNECRTLQMWEKYYELITGYFGGITIADLMKTEPGNDYVI